MPNFISLFLTPALASFILSSLLTPLVISSYKKLHILDDPQKNSHTKVTHTRPLPRGGGIPIFLSLLVVGLILIGFDKRFLGILLGAAILTLVGIADDIYNLNPYFRLATGALAALAVVGSGIGIAFITNPFGGAGNVIHLNQPQLVFELFGKTRTIWILADLFALFWILWTSNIVNWSKGLDGQMPGFVAIAAFFLGLLSFRFAGDFTQWPVIILAAITTGAYLGFLIFNFYPQKIMPGYSGGSLAGFLLAVLAILSGAKVAALILILGIPMADAVLTIFRRLFRHKSPVWGDRGHLHHRLLDSGWTKPQIALFYWISTFLLGLITLQLNSTQKIFTIILIGLGTTSLVIWLKIIKETVKDHK